MNRRSFLSLPLASCLLRAQPARPNIVILLADDLGWADVGFHGGEIQTPNLNRLAIESLEINRFYSCPVCSPTRSSLMTGRSPMRTGISYTVIRPWSNYGLPLEERTMPQAFQEAGYETAMAGKWHLGHADARFLPGARGFQHSYGHLNGAIDYYTHEREGGLDWHRNGKSLKEEGYSTELIGNEAVARIRGRDRSRPLLLYVPFNSPHTPLQAPQFLIDKYGKLPNNRRRTFAAMVDSMDTQIGKILSALEEERIAANTIVMFFSDNGGPTGQGALNTPLRGGKGSTWDGGMRVPTLLRYPGKLKAGAKSAQVATAQDVFPTLAAAAGVKPGNRLAFDGRNLWPQLTSGSSLEREDLFFTVENQASIFFAVYCGPWKLVRELSSSGGKEDNHLFRIADDPNEGDNLAHAHPGVVRDLVQRIEQWRRLYPANGVRFSQAQPDGWKAPAQWVEAASR